MLMQAVKDPVRAEWLVLTLRIGGLTDQNIVEWWESADIRGEGTPRTLWQSERYDEVERAAAIIVLPPADRTPKESVH
jgi:hypothetical protein